MMMMKKLFKPTNIAEKLKQKSRKKEFSKHVKIQKTCFYEFLFWHLESTFQPPNHFPDEQNQ